MNYTNFFEEKTTQTLTGTIDAVAQATIGTPAGTVDRTDLTLDDSFGVAAEVGLDYMLTDNLGVNAAVWWIDLDTDADIGVYAADGSKITTGELDVEIDPLGLHGRCFLPVLTFLRVGSPGSLSKARGRKRTRGPEGPACCHPS